MTVIEKINEINEVVKEIFDFTQTNETIKADFDEYLATIGGRNIPLNQMEKIFLPYIFERKINQNSILEMFKEEVKTKNEKIVESFLHTQASIFEIKKILKNGFELYNLINEKTYTVLSLTKMTNFRGVFVKIYTADFSDKKVKEAPGTICSVKDTVGVATGNGVLYIKSLQFGTYMISDVKSFIEKVKPKVGETFGR